MFPTNNCSSSGGVLHKQLTVFHHASYEEFICWNDTCNIIPIVSATIVLITCMAKYRKLLVQNSSWWRNVICSRHVEDNLIEINYIEICAPCWSCSSMCIMMHASENVKSTRISCFLIVDTCRGVNLLTSIDDIYKSLSSFFRDIKFVVVCVLLRLKLFSQHLF